MTNNTANLKFIYKDYKIYNRYNDMTTIAVDDDVRDDLLRISAELQLKLGRRVNYNDVLRYLLTSHGKRPECLKKAVIKGLDSNNLIQELRNERIKDEKKLERLLRS